MQIVFRDTHNETAANENGSLRSRVWRNRKGVEVTMTSARKLLGLVLLAVFSLSVVAHGSAKFKAAVSYAVGTKPSAAAVGDFNGDGKLDIAVMNSGDASVGDNGGLGILLGNGDGTFDTLTHIASTGFSSFVTGDFNRDGRLDLAIVDASGSLAVLLGNGDGT